MVPGLGRHGPQILVTVREPVVSDGNDSDLKMRLRCLALNRPCTKQPQIVSYYYNAENYHISILYFISRYKMLHEWSLEEDCYF